MRGRGRRNLVLALVLACISIGGCATAPVDLEKAALGEREEIERNVLARLDRYAAETSAAMQRLAAAEQASRGGLPPAPLVVPPGMERSVSFPGGSWTGPIEGLVEKLAGMSGYSMLMTGRKPPVPVIVSVAASGNPVAHVLYDAGVQAGKDADIIVRAKSRVVELRYPDHQGSGGWGGIERKAEEKRERLR